MSKTYSGGCACGAIRYEIAGEPLASVQCQCLDCQHTSGTGHGSYLTFPDRAAVTLTGKATHWDMVADSGNRKTRGFCPTCGAPVYISFAAMPELFTIHAASLDDPGRYQPQLVTYAIRATPGTTLTQRCRSSTRCRRCNRPPCTSRCIPRARSMAMAEVCAEAP